MLHTTHMSREVVSFTPKILKTLNKFRCPRGSKLVLCMELEKAKYV